MTNSSSGLRAVDLHPIAVPFNDDAMRVVGLRWGVTGATVIDVVSERSGRRACLEFTDDAGHRVLDELNLAGMWLGADPSVLQTTWLFEVRAGGWLDLEATRADFYNQPELALREFLIAGYQECVSVLASSGPVVREMLEEGT